MGTIFEALISGFQLVVGFDQTLYEILFLSLKVSLTALLISVAIGLPLGAFLAIVRFHGREVLLVVINALMGLPPVVVGLLVYLFLSRSGPLGWMGLLYTPTAMIIAQTVLIVPIVASLSHQVIRDINREYHDMFMAMSVPRLMRIQTLLWDARVALMTVILAGFGRAVSEVGAVIIVGGNIDHLTRVMTTAIALETARGDLELALGLGFVLLAVALGANMLSAIIRRQMEPTLDV